MALPGSSLCGARLPGPKRLQVSRPFLDRGLEFAALLGAHRLRTHGKSGSITLKDTSLPEHLRQALPGVELDRVVDHPLLAGSGAVITAIDERSSKWGTKVRFALEPSPWRMPWARNGCADPLHRLSGASPRGEGGKGMKLANAPWLGFV